MCSSKQRKAHIVGLVRALWVLPLLVQTAVWAQSAVDVEHVVLLAGEPSAARRQGTNERVSYAFDADHGQRYLVRLDQQGLDFMISVESPDGETRSYNSPARRNGSEYVLLDAALQGQYRLTINSNELSDAIGTHVIEISAIKRDTEARLQAWRLMTTGSETNWEAENARSNPASDDEESSQDSAGLLKNKSLDSFSLAAELWLRTGDQELEAQARYSMMMLEYWDMYNWKRAADLSIAAAKIYRDMSNNAGYANAVFWHGMAAIELANNVDEESAEPAASDHLDETAPYSLDRALTLFDEARTLYEKLSDAFGVAHVENNVGLVYANKGEFPEARRYWQKSAERFSGIGEWREEAQVRQNLAWLAIQTGNSAEAISEFESILEELPSGSDPMLRGIVLENLGAAHREFGNVEDSLSAYHDALGIQMSIGDQIGELFSRRGLGATYFASGELDTATEYLSEALKLASEADDSRTQSEILTILGNIEYRRGDYSAALRSHGEAIEHTESAVDRAFRQVLVAKDLTALTRYADARTEAQDALLVAEQNDSPVTQADALLELGRISLELEDYFPAIDYLDSALEIYQSLALQGRQADVLNLRSAVARNQGELEMALVYSAESLELIESLGQRVAAPELRALYSATRRQYYETQIDLMMQMQLSAAAFGQDFIEAALATNERARARMTMDLLAEASVDLEQGFDEKLSADRERLYEELAERRQQRDHLLRQESPGPATDDELSIVVSDMADISTELRVVDAELRKSSPQYRSFVSPDTLTTPEIQQLLDPQTVLLQYSLGTKRSFVWVITDEAIHAVELADRETIESAARPVFGGLSSYVLNTSARTQRERHLSNLSNLVLKPVAHLVDKQRILVAADGALQYVPFSVLPLRDGDATEALMATREVIVVPSMSVIASQRARESSVPVSKTVAIFADPVLEQTDPRIRESTNISTGSFRTSGLATRSCDSLRRLAATREEARAIANLVPQEARFVAEGFDANRDAVLKSDLRSYSVIHFATHGCVDARYPALSALALSQFDEGGARQNGYLRLHDIYNLELNADLVVLSACETALGREIHGEGLLGLSQGFMFAGAKSLVVSLWQVPDRATAELMTKFYDFMISQQLRPAEALRKAQLAIADDPRWRDPYFWGAFIIVGEWT